MLHEGKVALVTGGATGIGRATAIEFAREGARVAVADVNVEGGEETISAIRAEGGDAIFIPTDLLQSSAIREMVHVTVEKFGGLDAAFNNAGLPGRSSTVVDCDEANWDMVLGLDLKAVWLSMKYEIPEMIKRGGGAIVNTSSGMGLFAGPQMAPYIAAKHGVVGITKSAAVDFGPSGIRVNALLPGATDTQQLRGALQEGIQTSASAQRLPLRRIGKTEEQAQAVVWLTSDKASFVSGLSFIADGGLSAQR